MTFSIQLWNSILIHGNSTAFLVDLDQQTSHFSFLSLSRSIASIAIALQEQLSLASPLTAIQPLDLPLLPTIKLCIAAWLIGRPAAFGTLQDCGSSYPPLFIDSLAYEKLTQKAPNMPTGRAMHNLGKLMHQTQSNSQALHICSGVQANSFASSVFFTFEALKHLINSFSAALQSTQPTSSIPQTAAAQPNLAPPFRLAVALLDKHSPIFAFHILALIAALLKGFAVAIPEHYTSDLPSRDNWLHLKPTHLLLDTSAYLALATPWYQRLRAFPASTPHHAPKLIEPIRWRLGGHLRNILLSDSIGIFRSTLLQPDSLPLFHAIDPLLDAIHCNRQRWLLHPLSGPLYQTSAPLLSPAFGGFFPGISPLSPLDSSLSPKQHLSITSNALPCHASQVTLLF